MAATPQAPCWKTAPTPGTGSCWLTVLLTLLALAYSAGVGAQNSSNFRSAPPQPITICVLSSYPGVSLQTGASAIPDNTLLTAAEMNSKLQGVSIDTINAVFGQILQWPYNVRLFQPAVTGFSQTGYKVRLGVDCDVGVQAFFISAARDICLSSTACPLKPSGTVISVDSDYEPYVCCLDYSYPYYIGGWSFMSQVSTGGSVDYINVFFQRDIVQAICVSIICLFFFAHIIWLAERSQYGTSVLLTNPKEGFSRYYMDGMKDGVWFSTTTLMNGVVNSEKTIITPLGRLLSTVWVLFGILMSAFVTAVIAASLTTAQLTMTAIMTASDVAGKTVCIEAGFANTYFDTSFPGIGVKKVLKPNVAQCYPLATDGTVDAVFTVREKALGYFAAGNGTGLMIAPVVQSQAYGMIWPERWPYAAWVNEALLQWQQVVVATSPPYTDSIKRWYYGNANSITYGGNVQAASQSWNWALIGAAAGLIALYMTLQTFVIAAHWFMKRKGVAAQPLPDSSSKFGKSSTGGSGAGKHESRKMSFFLRAASAIAAPPDAMKLDGTADVHVGLGAQSFSRAMSMNPGVSMRGPSAKVVPSLGCDDAAAAAAATPHATPRAVTLSAQGSDDAAILAGMMENLKVLMAKQGARPQPGPDMQVHVDSGCAARSVSGKASLPVADNDESLVKPFAEEHV